MTAHTHTETETELLQLGSAVPAKPATIREFEGALRTLGYTRREAKAIATGGYRALSSEPDDLTQLAEKLTELADIFRK
ncbi:hypothetical protein [Polaromonas sp. SM01]|uniref:hypothetical protein n=1 Tax=Polaromonas sp. SM01 TaxID=3085630 RepID=UPI002981FE0B|nr:hypothetical protein [Polaromonas sp. SM01]MDW5441980.1 hypothetical protein [Polaromonas sp. SM01]